MNLAKGDNIIFTDEGGFEFFGTVSDSTQLHDKIVGIHVVGENFSRMMPVSIDRVSRVEVIEVRASRIRQGERLIDSVHGAHSLRRVTSVLLQDPSGRIVIESKQGGGLRKDSYEPDHWISVIRHAV